MKRNTVSSLCFLLVLMFLVGCAGEGAPNASSGEKDTLIVASNAGPVDLDPHGTNDQNTNDIRFQIYEGLVSVGTKGEILPCLATDWEWINDTTINFTLREGVKFHDGKELRPEDVLFSMKRALEAPFTVTYLQDVEVDKCSVLPDGKVQIILANPVSALLSRLSVIMIINEDTWTNTPEETLLENPCGTGPFKFVRWVDGDRIDFDAFDDYWEGKPAFNHLTIRFIPEAASRALEIEAGSADIATVLHSSNLSILESNPDVNILSTKCYMINYLGFDANKEPYNKKEVRQAISYAIDKTALARNVYESLGEPADYGRLSSVYWGYTEEGMTHYSYNPEKAKELLAEAGYPDGLTITLGLSEAEQDAIDMAEIIQAQLKDVGITVTLEVIENATFLNDIVGGNFDAFLLNSGGNSADPGEALKSFISTRPTWSNTTRYVNEYLTDLILTGQQTIDEDKKLEIFHEAQQIINDELPWVFLVHNSVAFATRSNIAGMVAYPHATHRYKEAYPVK